MEIPHTVLKGSKVKYETVLTTCPYCGCGCGLLLEVLDEEVIGVLPQKDHPVSEGALCIKGWSSHEFLRAPGRLTRPLRREGDAFVEASWDEALDQIAGRLREVKETAGPDAIAGLTSAKCTNEENYIFQKWMRAVVGTNNVDHCARL